MFSPSTVTGPVVLRNPAAKVYYQTLSVTVSQVHLKGHTYIVFVYINKLRKQITGIPRVSALFLRTGHRQRAKPRNPNDLFAQFVDINE